MPGDRLRQGVLSVLAFHGTVHLAVRAMIVICEPYLNRTRNRTLNRTQKITSTITSTVTITITSTITSTITITRNGRVAFVIRGSQISSA